MEKKKKKIKPFMVFTHCFFVIYGLLCVVPFVLLISISLTDETVVLNNGYSLIPKVFSTAAYEYIFKDLSSLISAYGVTIVSAFGGTLIGVVMMAALGYVLSREIFLFKKGITMYLLITMLFSGGLVPSYIINTNYLHLNNSIGTYLILHVFSAYTVFVFRTFFKSIPTSLIEAAEIDGASELAIMSKVILPMSKPVLATMAFNSIVSRWNDFEIPLYYITKSKLYNLQFMMQQILNEAEFLAQMKKMMVGVDLVGDVPTETLKFAMCILAAGPVLFLFPYFQKYFSKGMVLGSVKG